MNNLLKRFRGLETPFFFSGGLLMCIGIPAFFIATTGIDGSTFNITNISLFFIFLDIIGAILFGLSYYIGNVFESNDTIQKEST